MKKILCLVVALVMVAAVFAGCGNAGVASAAPTSQESAAASQEGGNAPTDGGKYKIGFSYWSNVDVLGKQFYDNAKAVAEGLGSEFMYLDWATTDLDGAQEAAQNLIEAGCDGIIAVMVTPGIVEMCEQRGVKLVQVCSSIDDPSLIELAKSSENYVGSVMTDDYQAGLDMAAALDQAGCKNIAYLSLSAGQATQHDRRVRGIEDYFKGDTDMKLVTNYRGTEQAEGVRQILTAYTEIDGLAIVGNDGTAIGAIYADGLQDRVKISTIDLQEGNDQYIQDGTIVWLADGQAPFIELSTALLYNALNGTPLLTGDARLEPVLGLNVYISSPEDFTDFIKYYQGSELVYSVDEIKNLIVEFNPDAKIEDLVQLAKTNGLDSVKSRHGG